MNRRVLIICNCSSGLNDFRGMLIDEFVKRDNSISAVIPISGDEVELKAEHGLKKRGCELFKLEIDRRGINPFKDVKLMSAYFALVQRLNPDIVITYTIKPNIYGGFVCRLLKIPYAVNITGLGTAFENGWILKKIVSRMYKVACKKAKVVFFENEENRQIFIREKIVKESQTYRLNGAGVDLDKYRVTEYPKGEKVKFLFMGRVMAEKGVNELFKAMKKLVADGINCELGVLGRYEEDYKEKIEGYESEGWLHYYGYQKDVRPFIEKCHCFVLPSWHEGMANTNLESAASGRPVITSRIPGCMESVVDEVSGYLAERKNAEDLYRVMKNFAELPYEERKALGLAGRKHMEEVFDKKKVVAETIKALGL